MIKTDSSKSELHQSEPSWYSMQSWISEEKSNVSVEVAPLADWILTKLNENKFYRPLEEA